MRGGALQRIGRLTPDITDPEEVDANCEFMYLSAHGLTNMEFMMVVPENTFILFMGRSAFTTYVRQSPTKLLINPNKDQYTKDMYNAFFKESPDPGNMEVDRVLRPYPDAYIYTPGDIIHNMVLSFKTNPHEYFFRLGLYTLPLTAPKDFIPSDDTLLIPFLLNYNREKLRTPAASVFKLNPAKKEIWNIMTSFPKRDQIAQYKKNYQNKHPITEWFESPEVLNTIIDTAVSPHAMRKQDNPGDSNKNKIPVDILRTGDGRKVLSTILDEYPSEKKYRFIIITACRPPDVDLTPSAEPSYANYPATFHPDPARLPPGTSIARRRLRRASFSVKGPDVTCPLGPGVRPMNLKPIKTLLNGMGDITFPVRENSFIMYLRFTLFKKEGDEYTYNDTITPFDLAQFVDKLYESYPLMESTKPEEQRAKEVFTTIFLTTKAIFHGYLSGITKNVGRTNKTIGELFLEFNNPNMTIVYSDEEKRQILGAMGASVGGRVKRTRKILKRRKSTRRRK
jgi:hypothetical protein